MLKKTVSFNITIESFEALNFLYADAIKEKEPVSKSALVDEALLLLYKKKTGKSKP